MGGAILALAVLVGGVGAYLLLPSATIVVTPRPERIATLSMTVVADTTATRPDPAWGVVLADLISIPVSANDTFGATGKRVALTKATGSVQFENLDPTSTNRIAGGSIVRTDSGVRFRTDVTITVPSGTLVADPPGFKILPGVQRVNVTAMDGGPDGNVDARRINNVPSLENPIFLKVSNPQATAGGTREEFTRVVQSDVDAALAALNRSLQQAFAVAIADPSIAPADATVFPSTGTLAQAIPDVPPDTLVGQEVPTFALSLSATGTVIAVDAAPVRAIAVAQLQAAVKAGYGLVEGSEDVQVGEAVVVGQSVSFPVTASARQIAILDPEVLRTAVLGKPIDDARAILASYGDVSLTVSPDWTGSVPGFESRVTLTIGHAVQIETPSPSHATPGPTRPPTPTGAPAPTASGSATP